jgi:hypothetical protein
MDKSFDEVSFILVATGPLHLSCYLFRLSRFPVQRSNQGGAAVVVTMPVLRFLEP